MDFGEAFGVSSNGYAKPNVAGVDNNRPSSEYPLNTGYGAGYNENIQLAPHSYGYGAGQNPRPTAV